MALLFGAHFSASSLDLAKGSNVILARIYPNVPHIDRFNLRPDVARKRLLDAESHLARIAIPYALSVHEDYLAQVKSELESASVPIAMNGRRWNAENMHAILFETLHVSSTIDISEFELLRRIRNSIIHQAGAVDDYVRAGLNQLTSTASAHWSKVVQRPADDAIREAQVSVGTGEIMLAFSVVRHLSGLVHEAMLAATTVPRTTWISECVDTFRSEHGDLIHGGYLLRRRLTNWAATNYDDFNFSWAELRSAAITVGIPAHQLRNRGER